MIELSLKAIRQRCVLLSFAFAANLKRRVSSESWKRFTLRQVLENVASFLGVDFVGYVLEQLDRSPRKGSWTNCSIFIHKNVYRYESKVVVPDNKKLFEEIFDRLMDKYRFTLHAPAAKVIAVETPAKVPESANKEAGKQAATAVSAKAS